MGKNDGYNYLVKWSRGNGTFPMKQAFDNIKDADQFANQLRTKGRRVGVYQRRKRR